MIKKLFSSDKFFISLLILFCFVIIAFWFKDGKLLATGEEGLMLINPNKTMNLYKYSWNEVDLGVGIPGAQLVPFFYFESLIVNLGLPVWIFQASIFFSLMFLGSLNIYLLYYADNNQRKWRFDPELNFKVNVR